MKTWVEVAPKLGAETQILSLVSLNGKIYGGTAQNGKLYQFNGTNSWVEVAPKLGAEGYILSLAVLNGKIYGGTALGGKLYEWNGTNLWVEVAPKLGDEEQIHALAVLDGKLYGGTSPGGKLYEFNGINSWVEVAPKLGAETFILSLAVLDGKLYGGTFPGGKLYEFNGTNQWVEVAPKLGAETQILSLAVLDGKIYGGTSPGGKLYEWNGTNLWVEVAPQLGAETQIRSLTVLDGKLYGGTANNGKLYEWNGTNLWVEVAPKLGAETIIYSLTVLDGNIYAGTANNGKLYVHYLNIENKISLKNPVKYIAELFKSSGYDCRIAIADEIFNRSSNVFYFSIKKSITDPSNYWIAWGGSFDNFSGIGIQVFFDLFLLEVFDSEILKDTENSFWIDTANEKVYVNISKNPWQYRYRRGELYHNNDSTFATSPKNELNLSDNRYGTIIADTRMDVPSLNSKLNDIISGINVYNSFSISIYNNDGKYDGISILNFFNTPMRIRKSTKAITATIEDYDIIYFGIISNIDIGFGSVTIEAVDRLYVFNKNYCKKFSKTQFPYLSDNDVDKNIPVAWGACSHVKLTEINREAGENPTWIDYIAIDQDYLTAVSKVYSSEYNELTFSLDSTTKTIRVTELDDEGNIIEAETADITGKTDNSIGQIIIFALSQNENIKYIDGIWDKIETDYYLSISAPIGFYFDSGTTKELIEKVLKNDIAFLLQKNDGRLTIRRWAENYVSYDIKSWTATKQPAKNFRDAWKYFCSSVKIKYGKNQNTNKFLNEYIDDSLEENIFDVYKKYYMAEFETDLLNISDVQSLAFRLLSRFGFPKETVPVSLGVNTFNINRLDKIQIDMKINDRQFSTNTEWIVKECNPGQDELVLESLN